MHVKQPGRCGDRRRGRGFGWVKTGPRLWTPYPELAPPPGRALPCAPHPSQRDFMHSSTPQHSEHMNHVVHDASPTAATGAARDAQNEIGGQHWGVKSTSTDLGCAAGQKRKHLLVPCLVGLQVSVGVVVSSSCSQLWKTIRNQAPGGPPVAAAVTAADPPVTAREASAEEAATGEAARSAASCSAQGGSPPGDLYCHSPGA